MNHWRTAFVNQVLPRAVYLAVRWADITELWVAYSIHRAFARLRFLQSIEVDLVRMDEQHEQGQIPYAFIAPGPPVATFPAPPPLGEQERGVWI